MTNFPEEVREPFMKDEHTVAMHHNAGLFNCIWSDMEIETTFMRYCHDKNGIIGITLQPETLKTWAYSIHACNKMVRNLDVMRNNERAKQMKHSGKILPGHNVMYRSPDGDKPQHQVRRIGIPKSLDG